MKPGPGAFVWYELMTTDVDAAIRYYQDLFGWKIFDFGMQPPYFIIQSGEHRIGGMLALRDEQLEAGARPFWGGYVGVPDVDAAHGKALSLGASEHVPPRDIPNVGRFSVIADPQGAILTLFHGAGAPPEAWASGHGSIAWHELAAAKWETVLPFYEQMFGWTKDQAIDIGEHGIYQLFAIHGESVGGMFDKPPELPVSAWLYYVEVEDLTAAIQRAEDGGGQVLMGPMEVPGGSWIAQCMDPQGGHFAMVSSKR